MMKKYVLLLMAFLIISSVCAVEPDEKINLVELEYKKLVIEEHAKTRADIKQYLDRKSVEYRKGALEDIEDNLRVLDDRIDDKIRSAGFKFGIIFFCGLVAGMMIVALIKRRIDKVSIIKNSIPDQHFQEKLSVPITPNIVKKEPSREAPKKVKKKKITLIEEDDNMIPLFKEGS